MTTELDLSKYREAIILKLNSLEESVGVSLFSEVSFGRPEEFSTPAAILNWGAQKGETADTVQNERTYRYDLFLYFKRDKEEDETGAELKREKVLSVLIDAFDKDIDLGGVCQRVKAVSDDPPNEANEALPYLMSRIIIEVVDFNSRC